MSPTKTSSLDNGDHYIIIAWPQLQPLAPQKVCDGWLSCIALVRQGPRGRPPITFSPRSCLSLSRSAPQTIFLLSIDFFPAAAMSNTLAAPQKVTLGSRTGRGRVKTAVSREVWFILDSVGRLRTHISLAKHQCSS